MVVSQVVFRGRVVLLCLHRSMEQLLDRELTPHCRPSSCVDVYFTFCTYVRSSPIHRQAQ